MIDGDKTPNEGQSSDYRFVSIESTADFLAAATDHATLTVLGGSGISLRSGLPLAMDLASALLEPLVEDPVECRKILSPKFPFESLIEAFDHYLPVGRLLQLFTLGTPSTIHLLIGKLLRSGLMKIAFTTNFDRLIERGFSASAGGSGPTLHILSSERRIKDCGRLVGSSDDPVLVKLHGTIDQPRTIKTTLGRITRRDPGRVLASTIEYLFGSGQHSIVLIIGYSCSDHFDISPSIPAPGPASKTIVHVIHPSGSTPSGYFEARPLSGVFEGYPGKSVVCDAISLLIMVWERLANDAQSFISVLRSIVGEEWKHVRPRAAEKRRSGVSILSGDTGYQDF